MFEDAASVTFAVKLKAPAAVGVPVIVPVLDRDNPGERAPEINAHEYGVTPPLAVSVCKYTVPTFPEGSVVSVVIANGLATVRLNVRAADKYVESAKLIVKLDVPATVGVPAIFPVVDSDNPGGSAPEITDQK